MKVGTSILLVLFLLSCCFKFAACAETAFLKEILQGRCYDRPPTTGSGVDECPTVVGSFMGVLENHLDADIQMTDFDESYLDHADVSSPPDCALIWHAFMGDNNNNNDESFAPYGQPPDLVTPQDTPGGAFVRDLTFCGIDQRDNCSIETSNAYWKFWQALYAKFVTHVKGRMQIVVEPKADVVFLERSLLPNLRTNTDITSITIYAMEEGSCSTEEITRLMTALQDTSIPDVTCNNDIVKFILCQEPKSMECSKYLKSSGRSEESYGTKAAEKTTKDYYSGFDGETTNDSSTTETVGSNSSSTNTAITAESESTTTTDSGEEEEDKHHRRHYFAKLFLFCGVVVGTIALFLGQRKRFGYDSVSGGNKYVPTAQGLPQ